MKYRTVVRSKCYSPMTTALYLDMFIVLNFNSRHAFYFAWWNLKFK